MASSAGARLRVGIVGLGRVGRSLLARCLETPSIEIVAAWNRTPLSPAGLPAGAPYRFGGEPPGDADLLLLAVSDEAIAPVAALLRPVPHASVAHLSGAAELNLLAALPAGISRGGWHPLQAFSAGGAGGRAIPPYAIALQGDRQCVARGRALAEALGHPCVELPPQARAAYHAAAVLASNGLVALQRAALRTLTSTGLSQEDGWRLLWPLVLGTVANLEGGPTPTSLTGPVVRGDADTVRTNRTALRGDPDADAVYVALSREALRLARLGGLAESAARRIELALAEAPASSG